MSKLVRDHIPEIIEKATGKTAKTKILEQTEYVARLREKLQEEVDEYLEEPCQDELVDITEVVEALAEVEGGLEEMKKIKDKKQRERGAYKKKILLVM
jgi:predicted house-cleaning noncanonical NTP pyrophosphatase (MazG superfamily)